jgi:translation initiation factor 2 subunit 3
MEQYLSNQKTYDEFIRQTMVNQPTCNIGTGGHVSNGKSTMIEAISGQKTQRHTDELERNITMKLGYANAKIWKCHFCDEPECYQSTESSKYEHICNICNKETKLVRHVSFTDVPGHNSFMTTMLNGTCVMDYAILIESASNDTFPAPQTVEHLKVLTCMGIDIKVICVNKMDLLRKDQAKANKLIDNMSEYMAQNMVNYINPIPIIPIAATLDGNIDVLCDYIANTEIPIKDLTLESKMLIVRSFNINQAKTQIQNLKGGVIGGTLQRGMIKLGETMLIYPGYIAKNDSNGIIWKCTPLKTKIISIHSEKTSLQYAIPGGSIGVQLDIDPALTGDDKLVGQIMLSEKSAHANTMKIFEEITINYTQFNDINIVLVKGQELYINVNANNIKTTIKNIKISEKGKKKLILKLEKPVCLELKDKIIINIIGKMFNDNSVNLIGFGTVKNGVECIINK